MKNSLNFVSTCLKVVDTCRAFVFFACVLSVILTDERSLHFELRQHTRARGALGSAERGDRCECGESSLCQSQRHSTQSEEHSPPRLAANVSKTELAGHKLA